MIREHEHSRLAVLLGKLDGFTASLIESQVVVNHTRKVVVVSGIVHLTALHHQEETLWVGRQLLDSRAGHLSQRRIAVGIPVQFVRHIVLSEECPHVVLLTRTHGIQVVLDDFPSSIPQISLTFSGDAAHTATDYHVDAVMSLLAGNLVILLTVIAVSRTVGRRGMREVTGTNQSRRLTQHLRSLQHRCQGLISTFGVNRIDIVLRVGSRIRAHPSLQAVIARHIARRRWSRVADRRVRAGRPHRTADIRVDRQVLLLRIRHPLIPAGRTDSRQRTPVGNHQDHVLHLLSTHHSCARHQQAQNQHEL